MNITEENEKQNSIAGTPLWMAPEQIEVSSVITTAVDIWSLACTVIELLTGQPPFYDLQNQCCQRMSNQFYAL